MARKKPTAQPEQRTLPRAAPAPAAPPSSPPDPLPLAHYLPRVPLQLFAVAFSLVAASTAQGKHLAAPQRIVAALVHDPLGTLPFVCAALALIQTWFGYWARGCRIKAARAAKGGDAVSKGVAAPKPRERRSFKANLGAMWDQALKGEAPHQTIWKKRSQTGSAFEGLDTSFVQEAVVTTLVGAAVTHACAVLLGASLTTNVSSTFLLSLLVSILALLPLSIAFPPAGQQERYIWLRLFSTLSTTNDLELALLAPALCTLAGAWAGAIPIPLDWDRAWQRWPVTPVLGALAGHALGSLAALGVISYRGAVRAAVDVLEEAKRGKAQ